MVILHADAVAEDRTARLRTGRVNRNNADRLTLFAIVFGQLIDERALARAGRASHADDSRPAGMRKERFEQIRPAGTAVLDS
jgi:hypothetical protein